MLPAKGLLHVMRPALWRRIDTLSQCRQHRYAAPPFHNILRVCAGSL